MGRLFWKFLIAFWLALILAGVGVGLTVILYQRAVMPTSALALEAGPRASFMITSTATVLRHAGVGALQALLLDTERRDKPQVHVFDDRGNELLGREIAHESVILARSLAERDQDPRVARYVTVGDTRYLLFVPVTDHWLPHHHGHTHRGDEHRSPSPPETLTARANAEPSLPHLDARPPPPVFAIAVGLVASLGFSALLAWYLAKPVRALRTALNAAAAGRLDTRASPMMGNRRDEIADLGHDFDRMAQQFQTLIASQRRLLHDVSHELRSPLARLQAAVGLARQNPRKTETTLDRIERETMRLDELVGELLTLARLESRTADAFTARLDLIDLLTDVCNNAQFEARSLGRAVRLSVNVESVTAAVHGELLQRAFENVIRNAVRFTTPSSTVEVLANHDPARTRLTITVEDRGPGVPESDLEAIFDAFYRATHATPSRGFGLGLAIARRAIEAHHGTIRARNRVSGGLRVEIEIPLADFAGFRGEL
ncbi:MAG: ATP-binding protein [Thiotrichales bacterium]